MRWQQPTAAVVSRQAQGGQVLQGVDKGTGNILRQSFKSMGSGCHLGILSAVLGSHGYRRRLWSWVKVQKRCHGNVPGATSTNAVAVVIEV